MAEGGTSWTLVSGGLDSVLLVPAFSPSLPRGGRLIVKGDNAMLETLGGNGAPLAHVRLALPATRGAVATLFPHAGAFGSVLVIEEEEGAPNGRRHLYEAVICVMPTERDRGST